MDSEFLLSNRWSLLKHKENSKTKCGCIEKCQIKASEILSNPLNIIIVKDVKCFSEKKQEDVIVKNYNVINIGNLEKFILSKPEVERNFYELIQTGQKRRLFVDVDVDVEIYPDVKYNEIKDDIGDLIMHLTTKIPDILLGEDVISNDCRYSLYSSHSDKKISYHIVYNLYSETHYEMKAFMKHMKNKISQHKSYGKYAKHIDLSVYSGNRPFRLEYCAKYGQNRFKKRENGNFINGIICYTSDCHNVTSFMKKFIKDEPKKISTKNLVDIKDEEVDEILNSLKIERAEEYSSWLSVGMVLYNHYNGDNIGFAKWDKFSSKAKNYDESALDDRWLTFGGKCNKPLTIGTLIKWACEDSKEYAKKRELNKPLSIFNIMDRIENGNNFQISQLTTESTDISKQTTCELSIDNEKSTVELTDSNKKNNTIEFFIDNEKSTIELTDSNKKNNTIESTDNNKKNNTIESTDNNEVTEKTNDPSSKDNSDVKKIAEIEPKPIEGIFFLYYMLRAKTNIILSDEIFCLRNSISDWKKGVEYFGFTPPSPCSGSSFEKSKDEDFIYALLYATIAIIINGGKFFYVTKNFRDGLIQYEVIQRGGVLDHYITYQEKRYVEGKNDQGELKIITKKTSVKNLLSTMIEKRIGVFDFYDFIPYSPKQLPPVDSKGITTFNSFTGFRAQKITINDNPITDDINHSEIHEIIEPILFHIHEIFANRNDDIYIYIIKWLASFFQKPRNKLTCLYFYSEKEGTGKTGFFNWLIDEVIGEQYCVMCDMEKILGKFNSALDKNLLCVFNEAKDYGEGYSENDKLKSIISDPKHVIENKGIDCRKITNNTKVVILTNNVNSVKIKKGDRRYCVIDLNNNYACNKEYFDKFYKRDLNTISARAFYTYLMDLDIEDWNHEQMPITEIKKSIFEACGNYTEKFLSDLYNDEYEHVLLDLSVDKPISSSQLFNIFTDWHITNRHKVQMSSTSFSTQLYKIIPRKKVTYNNKRVNGIIISKQIISSALNIK